MNVAVDRFSPSGLIQRKNLGHLGAYSAPETEVQHGLQQIWSGALGLDTVGIDDDFFDIGGTSGKAVSIFAEIQKQWDSQLPLSTLYAAPTIRALAELIAVPTPSGNSPQRNNIAQYNRLVTMSAAGHNPPLFMIPGSGGNAISLAHIARAMGGDRPVYGLDARGLDGSTEFLYDQYAIAAEHASIIEAAYPGPYYLLGVCHGAMTAYEVARILSKKGKQVVFLGLLDPMTVSLPRLKPNSDGKITVVTCLKFMAEHFSYWRKRYRKQFIRDRLGILSKRDRRDPQRPTRRKLSKANAYAGRRYEPGVYGGPVHLFLTRDCEEGRKKDGRQHWIDMLDKPGNSILYVAGTLTSDLYAPEGAPGFAATVLSCLAKVSLSDFASASAASDQDCGR